MRRLPSTAGLSLPEISALIEEVEAERAAVAAASDDLSRDFCSRFKETRKLTSREAAKALGISQAFLLDIEKGRRRASPELRARMIKVISGR